MTGLAALKASIIVFIGLAALVYGLAGQTELRAGLDGQSFCKATWPDGETWIWTRLGAAGSDLPFTVTGDRYARCQVADNNFVSGSRYYVAHRGDNTADSIGRLDRTCGPDDAPCAVFLRENEVLTSITRGNDAATPVWADLSVTGINPLYDLLGRPLAALVTLLAVFSFGAQAWRAWDS